MVLAEILYEKELIYFNIFEGLDISVGHEEIFSEAEFLLFLERLGAIFNILVRSIPSMYSRKQPHCLTSPPWSHLPTVDLLGLQNLYF